MDIPVEGNFDPLLIISADGFGGRLDCEARLDCGAWLGGLIRLDCRALLGCEVLRRSCS